MRVHQTLREDVGDQLQSLDGLFTQKDVAGEIDMLVGVGADQQAHVVPFGNRRAPVTNGVNEATKSSIAGVAAPNRMTAP